MTTLYRYKVWCSTDSKWEYIWDESTPTVCPANNGHTITSGSTTIVDTVSENTTTIKEEQTATGGHFQVSTVGDPGPISIPASTGDHTTDQSEPLSIGVLSVSYVTTSDHTGDGIEVHVSPDTTVAVLTSAVAAPLAIVSAAAQGTTGGASFTQIVATGHTFSDGDTVYISGNDVISDGNYTVSNSISNEFEIDLAYTSASTTQGTVVSKTIPVSATANMAVGYHLKLVNGGNNDDLGRILSVGAGSVVVETAPTQAFAASTTLCQITVKMMRKVMIGPAWQYTFGDDKIGASYVNKNTVVRIVYTNNSGTAKDLYFNVEYLY